MLTESLQEEIAKGRAVYKTWALGGSGVGTILIPEKKFIIITDFDYEFFCDFPTQGAVPSDFVLKRSVFQLEFRSQKSQNQFIFRNPMFIDHVNGTGILSTVAPIHKDTYLVHQENVQVNIVNVPDATNWITTYSTLPSKSLEAPEPMGYGILAAGQPAVRKIIFTPGEEYLPLTSTRDDIVANSPQEQFRVKVDATNKLNDVRKDALGNYSYPIVNVGYVEFSRNPNQFVKASN